MLEQMSTRADHVTSLAAGDILRSSFLRVLDITTMEHGDPDDGQV
jgi:hypothetical protein